MKAPCEECLKMAICISQGFVKCKDLSNWVVGLGNDTRTTSSRINYFESQVWNKDISTINSITGQIRFKDTIRDNYQALIIKDPEEVI